MNYTFRRTVWHDGWGIEIRWAGRRLCLHHIQFPTWPSPLVDYWDRPGYRGFVLDHLTKNGVLATFFYPGIYGRNEKLAVDLAPFCRMLQATRRAGGPADPIIDWLMDIGNRDITEMLS